MRRLPWTISLIRRGGTPMATATLCWVIPSGSMKSSISTSPGWIGANLLIAFTSSVVVNDLDVFRASVGPGEADPPLVVDPDAVLAPSVALQCLQPVAWWDAKVVETHRRIQDRELPQGRSEDPRVERPDTLALPESFGVPVPHRPHHQSSITRLVNNVTR